jgi:hypothetical protein
MYVSQLVSVPSHVCMYVSQLVSVPSHVCMYVSQLVSVQSLKFPLSNSFEIYTQGQEPLKEGQVQFFSFWSYAPVYFI